MFNRLALVLGVLSFTLSGYAIQSQASMSMAILAGTIGGDSCAPGSAPTGPGATCELCPRVPTPPMGSIACPVLRAQ